MNFPRPLSANKRQLCLSYGSYQNSYQPRFDSRSLKPSRQPSKPHSNLSRSNCTGFYRNRAEVENGYDADVPYQLIQLIENERKNISKFKQMVQLEKKKVEEDFSSFKTQTLNVIDDAKLTLQAQLDSIYVSYMEKYAYLKNNIQELRAQRKQILLQNQPYSSLSYLRLGKSNLVREVEQDILYSRQFQARSFLGEVQKNMLNPVNNLTHQLEILNSFTIPLYRKEKTMLKMDSVRINLQDNLRSIHNSGEFIFSIDAILGRSEDQQKSSILQPSYTINKGKSYQNTSHSSGIKSNQLDEINSNSRAISNQFCSRVSGSGRKQVQISSTQQGLLTNQKLEALSLAKLGTISTSHTDSVLCICFIDGQIATGSKDKTINVYNMQGIKIKTLKGHDASITCLRPINTQFGQFLASGSDHGCSSIILWSSHQWSMKLKKQYHTAAISGIIDLEDSQHLLTSGYDKKVHVLNYMNGEVIFSLTHYKSPITNTVITADRSKVVVACLDNSLNVVGLVRKYNMIQALRPLRTINCDNLVCSMQSLAADPSLVVIGLKDGRIQIIDVENGNCLQNMVCHDTSVIQMVLFESQVEPACLVASCSITGAGLTLTNTKNCKNCPLPTEGKVNIEFGCGVGPKIIFDRHGRVAILNQSSQRRQFSIYKLNNKLNDIRPLSMGL